MNKEQLYNFAISKLSNKKISNAQKATVRQLVDAGVIYSNAMKGEFRRGGYCVSEKDLSYMAECKKINEDSFGRKKPECNQTGLFWRWMSILALLAFLGSLAVEIVSLYW